MIKKITRKRQIRPAAVITLLSLAVFILNSCRSAITRLDPAEETGSTVIYMVPADEFPNENRIEQKLPATEAFPELSEEEMNALLRSFRFEQKSLWGRTVRPAFYEEELRYLGPVLVRQFRKLPENHRLAVVSRHDPDKSVLSRMDRITFVVWNDETGINFLFGEIRNPVPINDPFAEDNWKDIAPINPVRPHPDYRIIQPDEKGQFFNYKEIKGKEHYTWVVIDRSSLENIAERFPSPEKAAQKMRIAQEEYERKSAAPVTVKKSLADRLRELREAYDAKLISESEYESGRKAILGNH